MATARQAAQAAMLPDSFICRLSFNPSPSPPSPPVLPTDAQIDASPAFSPCPLLRMHLLQGDGRFRGQGGGGKGRVDRGQLADERLDAPLPWDHVDTGACVCCLWAARQGGGALPHLLISSDQSARTCQSSTG